MLKIMPIISSNHWTNCFKLHVTITAGLKPHCPVAKKKKTKNFNKETG